MANLPPSPFITDPEHRFTLNEEAFMAAIEPPPVFLGSPSQEYLRATEILPIVQTLAHFFDAPIAHPEPHR